METKNKISGLVEIISNVKRELEIASKKYLENPSKPELRLRTVSLEFSVLAEESSSNEGGINLKILTDKTLTSDKQQLIHKISLIFDVDSEDSVYSRIP